MRDGRYNDNPDRESRCDRDPSPESQIMWARCRAPYHIQAPTTAQRKGQGLRPKRIGKARGRLFSTLIDYSLVVFDGWTKENARLEEWCRCSRAISCLRGSNKENLNAAISFGPIYLANQIGNVT